MMAPSAGPEVQASLTQAKTEQKPIKIEMSIPNPEMVQLIERISINYLGLTVIYYLILYEIWLFLISIVIFKGYTEH